MEALLSLDTACSHDLCGMILNLLLVPWTGPRTSGRNEGGGGGRGG